MVSMAMVCIYIYMCKCHLPITSAILQYLDHFEYGLLVNVL